MDIRFEAESDSGSINKEESDSEEPMSEYNSDAIDEQSEKRLWEAVFKYNLNVIDGGDRFLSLSLYAGLGRCR
jgi:hypothetical protein